MLDTTATSHICLVGLLQMSPGRLSAIELQQQLLDIDGKLSELELRGRHLEDSIRSGMSCLHAPFVGMGSLLSLLFPHSQIWLFFTLHVSLRHFDSVVYVEALACSDLDIFAHS